jgi:3-(methylthio)propanoyl-CoA dehydrogenase
MQGAAAYALIAEMRDVPAGPPTLLNAIENASLAVQVHGGMGFIEETGVAQHYRDACIAPIYDAVETATTHLLKTWGNDPASAMAGATPYLTLFATVAGGWLMVRAALAASEKLDRGEGDPRFLKGKLQSAQFYTDHVLPQATGVLASTVNSTSITTFDPDLL